MGRRSRQRTRGAAAPSAPTADYTDSEGNVLTLRGSLTPKSRRRYLDTLEGGLHRDDAWQRATELLFEHLAVSWTIAGLPISGAKELLGRYRLASPTERSFVRDALRAHLTEQFPELPVP
jgi:hypothetical protein